jgi:hypothetical protein
MSDKFVRNKNRRMKNIYSLALLCFSAVSLSGQTPFQRVYTILNTKCQNAGCHSATATDASAALRFDGSEMAVYNSIFNRSSGNTSSVAKFEKLVKPQHPYYSFLLRKIAGASFDTDLAIDTATEGSLMNDINGQPLSNKEIEFVRQWIMFGAKQTYGASEPKPDWQVVLDYYDNPAMPFLPKPSKPAAGTGLQVRMGPVFLPATGSTEQEWLEQQEINFPFEVEIDRIDGIMNQQSHHFLLFKFQDTTEAANTLADRNNNMAQVSILTGQTSFDGNKYLTSAWQDDAEMHLPPGTAIFWDKKTVLDMNYHVKNYNPGSVLPCDFYLNIYYKPRNPNTIEMKSHLVNNTLLVLFQGNQQRDYDDPDNRGNKEVRYLWNLTSHAHKYGTDFDLYVRDTTGNIADKIYEGFNDYENGGIDLGYYPWDHPSIEYWPNLLPVNFGKHNGNNSGLVARSAWNVQQPLITFGFTSNDEMQLFYYMYTNQNPFAVSAINDDSQEAIYFQVMPNPMSGNGKLVYTLAKPAIVKAAITDLTGKLVAALSSELQSEGVHEIEIGGSTKLGSGIYFVSLSLDGIVYTKKFVVAE